MVLPIGIKKVRQPGWIIVSITMNEKEILRLNAIRDVCEKRIRRSDAAGILSLSVHQEIKVESCHQ